MERGTMSEFILILLWVGAIGIVIGITQSYRIERTISGVYEYRVTPIMAFIMVAPLIWMTANRGYVGDTGAYYATFKKLPSSFGEIAGFVSTEVSKDKGFYFFSSVLKALFGGSWLSYFLPIALIQGLAVMHFFRKYTKHYALAIFLFLASSDYISWMYNGIRQFMAVIILILATDLIIKKKYIPLIAVVLFASTMHQSALLMIPLVIIAQGEAWNKKTVLFLICVILAMAFVDQFTDILDGVMQDTQYANMVTDWTEQQDDGANPLRVAVYAVPTILSLIGIKYIREANDPLINFCTNMSIYATGMYLVSMVTSGIFLGRLPIYGTLNGYILLVWEIEYMFKKESAHIIRICMIGSYLLFYVYQMHFAYGMF